MNDEQTGFIWKPPGAVKASLPSPVDDGDSLVTHGLLFSTDVASASSVGASSVLALEVSPSGTYGITVTLIGTEISHNVQIYNISFCLYEHFQTLLPRTAVVDLRYVFLRLKGKIIPLMC